MQTNARFTLLPALLLVSAVIITAYSLLWFYVKNQVDTILSGVASGHSTPAKINFSHDISGFPFNYVITLSNLSVSDPSPNQRKTQESMKLPAANFNYTSIVIPDDVTLKLPVFGNSVQLRIPKTSSITGSGGPMDIYFDSTPLLEVAYDIRNYQLIALFLSGAADAKHLLKKIRHIHYEDAGMRLSNVLGKDIKGYASNLIDLQIDPEDNTLKSKLNVTLMDSYTKPGYYAWYYNKFDTRPLSIPVLRDVVIYTMDYPLYAEPLSMNLSLEATLPLEKDANKPIAVKLEELTLSDKRGDAVHQADLKLYKGTKLAFEGYYTLRVDAFPEVLDNYMAFAEGLAPTGMRILGLVAANKKGLLPSTEWVQANLPLIKIQLLEYMKKAGLLDANILTLKIAATDKNAESTLNGKPIKEQLKLAVPYIAPILQSYQQYTSVRKQDSEKPVPLQEE